MSLELNLSGKTAIVTGGSAGIGLATAKALYSEGVNVVIAARNQERLYQAVVDIQYLPNAEAKVISVSADLTKAEDVEKVVPQPTVNEPNSGKSESTQRSTSASSSRIPVPKASRKSKQDKSSDLEDFIVPDSEEEEEVSDEEEEDSFEVINPIPTRSKGRSRSPRRATGPQIVCKYGRACYRKNPVHFQEFAHPWLPGGGPP